MKKSLIAIIALAIVAAFVFAACNSLEPANSNNISLGPFVEEVYTAEDLFPDGDVEKFVILPRNGWIAGPGDQIFFKALLLDEETGIYKDVTNDDRAKWRSTLNGGSKMFNGSNPQLSKRPGYQMEIEFNVIWDKKISAQSVGAYVVPAEYEEKYKE